MDRHALPNTVFNSMLSKLHHCRHGEHDDPGKAITATRGRLRLDPDG
jgi:hypothetical protein